MAKKLSAHKSLRLTKIEKLTFDRFGCAFKEKPMSDRSVRKALRGSLLKPADWYRELNSRVFFWLSEQRLNTLMNARAYRHQRNNVYVVETRALVERHEHRIMLSAMNSGCTIPFPHRRGLKTFRRIAEYPYASRKRNRDPIVDSLSITAFRIFAIS